MSAETFSVRTLSRLDEREIWALAKVLVDCVEGGASVSFMPPLDLDRAAGFWRKIGKDVAEGSRAVLVAEDAEGICGTVQLIFDLPENQPHRADLAKMLVLRRVRRQGVGESLLRAAEAKARALGKNLLVLDAVTSGPGARLYEKMGWVKVGTIPQYALLPNREFCDTTIYYRRLA